MSWSYGLDPRVSVRCRRVRGGSERVGRRREGQGKTGIGVNWKEGSPMNARSLVSRMLVVLCAVAGVLAFLSAPASAFLAGSFGPEGPISLTTFANVQGVAVDQSTGDVYVYDSGANGGSIYKFNSEGSPVDFSGLGSNAIEGVGGGSNDENEIAVDSFSGPAKGDIYIARGESHGDTIGIFSSTGQSLGVLSGEEAPGAGDEPCGVAVDPVGHVYVSLARGDVDKYTPTGNPVVNADYTSALSGVQNGGENCNIAVDGEENAYVGIYEHGPITKYPAAQFNTKGEVAQGTLVSETGSTLAADPSSNDLYVDERDEVVELDSSGNQLAVFGASGEGALNGKSYGVAVNADTTSPSVGDVYTSDGAGLVDIFGPLGAITAPASGEHGTSATLNGTVYPGGREVVACEFEYGTQAGVYTEKAPCSTPHEVSVSEPLTGLPVAVSTGVTGLAPAMVYHYRLVVEYASHELAEGQDEVIPAAPAIEAGSESVSDVTASSAILEAQVNPDGADTTYYFQYGTVSCAASTSSCTSIPFPPGSGIGSGIGVLAASTQVRSLTPSTTYHYRVLASNTVGTVEGPDQTFTTQPAVASSMMLDGRAWEMVSPLEKNDALITGIDGEPGRVGGMPQAAADGEAMVYGSQGAFAGPAGAPLYGQYLARRGVGGWSTVNIMPPVVSGAYTLEEAPYQAFSGELSSGLLLDGDKSGERGPVAHPPLTEGAPEGYPNFYVHELGTGTDGYRPVLTSKPGEPSSEFNLEFVGATPDLKHMVFSTGAALTPEAVRGEASFSNRNLYEWSDGQFQFVGGPGAFLGADVGSNPAGLHAISDNGSRVYFTREGSTYVRENIGTPQARTVAVPGGEFRAASSDGSMAFLAEEGGDLYEFDLETEQTVDLAPGAEVQGVLGVSEDGSYVYFVANGVLAEGASHGGCSSYIRDGGPQTCNLYVWHRDRTSADTIKFIATLSGDDNNEVSEKHQENHERPDDWAPDLEDLTSRVSADGLNVVFMSDGHLTDYDNRNSETGQRMQEVYDYNAGTGVLSCVSCDPSGARPRGASYIPAGTGFGGSEATYQSRVLSDVEGRARVFFDSSDALVPQDTNGEQDVYEWEEDGSGSCRVAAGCVGLISSGTSSEASAFLDASADGDDVFFLTASRLVAQDTDNLLDVYDARSPHVPGETVGSPVAAPVSPPCNNGDSCKPPPSAQPAIFGAPASATFTGAGNVTASLESVAQPKSKPLTRAQKLSKALAACGRKRKARRASCQAQARKRYGTASGLGRDKTAKGGK
jgi:hypothetical protein